MNNLKVIVADDHPVVRDSLKLFFQTQLEAQQVEEASNGNEFLLKLSQSHYDLAMIDIQMPEKNGIEATQIARSLLPNLRIIAFSNYEDINLIHRVLEAGANGYILKNADFAELKLAVISVLSNKTYYSAKVFDLLSGKLKAEKNGNYVSLTEREIEILRWIAKGYSRAEIAKKLFISERTFDKHRENLLLKTNCSNNVSLILFSLKNNIISINEVDL